MRSLKRSTLFIILLCVMASAALAQAPQKQGTGIITGRVTLGEKGMANVVVALYPSDRTSPQRISVARATTDYEGRYRLMNVPAGRYNIIAIAPTMVGPSDGQYGDFGKFVTVAEGETVEKMDIALARGGVITGRITDADGAPVVEEQVRLNLAEKQLVQGRTFPSFNPFMFRTDDRGIYRIYGIPPGRYTVSVGESAEDGSIRIGYGGRGYYTRTFHPGVTDAAKATVIEVTEGSEATNVDITLGRKAQTFTATGRVVDENGKPVAGVYVAQGAVTGDRIGAYGMDMPTDQQGHFRLDGLSPGRYAAFVWNNGKTDGYSDPVVFEIAEGDVSGLELKLRQGSSISGVAVIEGTTNSGILAKLSELSLIASPSERTEGLTAPNFSNTKIAPDGSFRLGGLRQGKFRLYLGGYPPPKGFVITRVEREGVTQPLIEVGPGALVTNVRVVLEYGTGTVRGLVKSESGSLPEGSRISVSARRVGEGAERAMRGAQADSRGHFVIEGLPTGNYELLLSVQMINGRPVRLPPIKQSVSVVNGAEAEVTFTVDLNAKPVEGSNND